jgi:hypothetical protein
MTTDRSVGGKSNEITRRFRINRNSTGSNDNRQLCRRSRWSHTEKRHEGLYAFTEVTVVLVTEERLIPHQTVLVRDGTIEVIRSSGDVEVPAGTVVINSSGRFLMPGLVDIHTHIYDRNNLVLLTANGVTSVRNMLAYPGWARIFGFPDILALKSRIEQGEFPGPTIFATGPVLEGRNSVSPVFTEIITNEREAERSVRDQYAQWYDFVKVYD